MTKTILIGIVLIQPGEIAFARGSDDKAPGIEYSDPVSEALETIREKHNPPAPAAAVVVDGKIVATNAVGYRKFGGPEEIRRPPGKKATRSGFWAIWIGWMAATGADRRYISANAPSRAWPLSAPKTATA
jgi:hypothetical protein